MNGERILELSNYSKHGAIVSFSSTHDTHVFADLEKRNSVFLAVVIMGLEAVCDEIILFGRRIRATRGGLARLGLEDRRLAPGGLGESTATETRCQAGPVSFCCCITNASTKIKA